MEFKFFNKKKKAEPKEPKEQRSLFNTSLPYSSLSGYSETKAMLLSAVYRCVDVISDSVAQLPLEPYFIDKQGYKTKFIDHSTYNLLNYEPNPVMSRFTFIKSLVVSVLLRGNGYAYIERDSSGNVKSLNFLESSLVTPILQNGRLLYNVTGMKTLVESINMIHILNFSYNGITGISTLQHAKNTLGLALDSEAHASGFFKGGANLAGILKLEGSLTEQQKLDLKAAWQTAFDTNSGNPNGVAVLEGHMSFEPVTVCPSDAQLLETREFNVIDICRFFGVSPVKAFDFSKSSYSTVEATQIAFLTDTIAPLLEKIELEFKRKLYKPSERAQIDVKFNSAALLKADKASQAAYYCSLFQIGVISPNEIRKELDLPALKNGDHTFVQVNTMILDNAINQKHDDKDGTKTKQK